MLPITSRHCRMWRNLMFCRVLRKKKQSYNINLIEYTIHERDVCSRAERAIIMVVEQFCLPLSDVHHCWHWYASNERVVVVLEVIECCVLNAHLMSRLFRTCLRPKISNETTKILIEKMCTFVRKGATSSTKNFLPLQHQVSNNPIKSTTTTEQQQSVFW